jgi:hypothetical protein
VNEGLGTLSIVSQDWSDDIVRPKYIAHETFHAGQSEVGRKYLGEPTIKIHQTEWAEQNPYIQEMSSKFPGGRGPDEWAQELPAYIAEKLYPRSLQGC